METCRVCGRSPAQTITLRRHVGMLVMQRFVRFRGQLCRDHARALAKEYLGKTLVQGWWGVISFFANFVAVATDLQALRAANRMPAPTEAPPRPHVPVAAPAMPPPPA